ncbi:hypothetical protein J2S43_001160 [Catenuloplanes nepalensis]|uniref:Uncharacterized protein n=1 Tax=Catenuloplanes nepalensis TaxID=587533 RepID=A0ABT9MMY4_9ACTN|nr:hypothetical protein [Catenuloplanes nepalensis]MDP9792648.1 hypothetical protein [Catenuloplanes nepalensis]
MNIGNEEEEARRMLAPLAEEPSADPKVDVDETMRVGTRRRRTRMVAGGATFAAVLAVTAGVGFATLPGAGGSGGGMPFAAGPSEAPALPGAGSFAPEGKDCVTADFVWRDVTPWATDRTGRWTLAMAGKYQAPVLLENGKQVAELSMDGVGAGGELIPAQVNSAGSVAAWSYTGGEASKAWVFNGGTGTQLKGTDAQATAISENGVLGGKANEKPVVWASPAAEPAALKLPEGYKSGEVVGLGDDGRTVVGTIGTGRTTEITWSDSSGTGAIWASADAAPELLPLPEGAEWVRPTAARGDWVVGLVSDGSAFRYNIAEKELDTLPGQIVWPVAVTSDGAVAGTTVTAPIVFSRGTGAVVLVGDEVRTVRPGDPEGSLYTLGGLTDDLEVIGYMMPPSPTGVLPLPSNGVAPSAEPETDGATSTGQAFAATCS